MTTIGDPTFSVGITFENATLNLSGDSLENQLNSKASYDHTHDFSSITGLEDEIERLSSDYIKTENGNATINGVLNCSDVRFKLKSQETLLSEKFEALDSLQNMTIQHLTLTADPKVKVGYPVFFTGQIIGKNFSPITISSTDCVPIVKASGDWSNFAGICTEVDVLYYGKTKQKYKGKEHAYIRFATHGDFQMGVKDSSKYKVGDLITFDGNIVNPDDNIDYKTMKSIVGSVSAIVKKNSIAIFRI